MEGIEAGALASIAEPEHEQEPEFYCRTCDRTFSAERALLRHIRRTNAHNSATPFACSVCHKWFSRKDVRDRHERSICAQEQPTPVVSNNIIPAKRTFEEAIIESAEHHPRIYGGAGSSVDLSFNTQPRERKYLRGIDGASHWMSLTETHLEIIDEEPDTTELHHAAQTQAERSRIPSHSAFVEFDAELFALGEEGTGQYNGEVPHAAQPEAVSRTGWFDMAWLKLSTEMPRHHHQRQESDEIPSLCRSDSTNSTSPSLSPGLTSDSGQSQARIPLDVPSVNYSLPFGARQPSKKRTSIVLKKFGNVCNICGTAYEPDTTELYKHLYGHFDTMEYEHSCATCNIRFARKADLEHHISCAAEGECGFAFAHVQPCTGHHQPSTEMGASPASDHDRFQLSLLLRAWELSQLHVHQASVHCLDENKDKAALHARFSLPESALRHRASLASSLVYSLKSFHSEPTAEPWDEQSALDSIGRKMGQLALRTPLGQIRQRRQKLKELQTANAALGPAASRGDLTLVGRLLAQGANVDIQARTFPGDSLTPLMLASAYGHGDVVSLLIDHGATLSLIDSKGETALHKACEGDHANVVQILVDAGADPCLPNADGDAPLFVSIIHDSSSVVDLLLDNKTLPDYSIDSNLYGDALLHLAVENNSVFTVKVLLSRNIDPNALLPEQIAFGPKPLQRLLARRSTEIELKATPLDRALTLGGAEMEGVMRAAGGQESRFEQHGYNAAITSLLHRTLSKWAACVYMDPGSAD